VVTVLVAEDVADVVTLVVAVVVTDENKQLVNSPASCNVIALFNSATVEAQSVRSRT
jgi:hypothetical protein